MIGVEEARIAFIKTLQDAGCWKRQVRHCAVHDFRAAIHAAMVVYLEALRAAGYVVVPGEPTEEMVVDGFEAMKGDWQMCREASEDADRCWRAMIAASPFCGDIKT